MNQFQTIDDIKWYAIYTNPRAEKTVAKALSGRGFEVYLPLYTTIKQWSDRKKKVEEPLFKSYLFVNINYEKSHSDLLTTPGIVKFVRTGKEPTSIRHQIIDAIKISLMHFDDITTTSENLKLNQKVEVIAGPLKGMEGVIAEQFGNKYFAINIDQLGTHILLKVPAGYLNPILPTFRVKG